MKFHSVVIELQSRQVDQFWAFWHVAKWLQRRERFISETNACKQRRARYKHQSISKVSRAMTCFGKHLIQRPEFVEQTQQVVATWRHSEHLNRLRSGGLFPQTAAVSACVKLENLLIACETTCSAFAALCPRRTRA